MLDDRLS
ncbi:hypothetical protein D046_2382A, partial [Vibrio parahaemolyticus V-223/04]